MYFVTFVLHFNSCFAVAYVFIYLFIFLIMKKKIVIIIKLGTLVFYVLDVSQVA